jgi:hypothetical protein
MLNNLFNKSINLGIGMIGVGVAASFCTFVVDGGEKAIMLDTITGSGVGTKVLSEGIHFRIPKL